MGLATCGWHRSQRVKCTLISLRSSFLETSHRWNLTTLYPCANTNVSSKLKLLKHVPLDLLMSPHANIPKPIHEQHPTIPLSPLTRHPNPPLISSPRSPPLSRCLVVPLVPSFSRITRTCKLCQLTIPANPLSAVPALDQQRHQHTSSQLP